ncbi:hypothetical protein Tco_1275568 [Tanacetum coccineum]
MVEEVTSLKMDFQQKENKYLEEFLDMKALKEKIVKPNHDRALVHDSKDTIKIAETTMKQMLDKMNDLEYVKKKAKALKAKAKFTEMHDAHTVVQARCLELQAKLSKFQDKIQNDDHDEMIKHFSHLEVNHLNLQLKYQHLKESFGNKHSIPARDVPDFDSVFEIRKMKASIQGKDNAIKKLKLQISQLKDTRSEIEYTLDFRALDF